MLRLAQPKEREGARAYLEDALVAGKGLGEDRTNGAAARPVVAAREGRAREERESQRRRERKSKEMNLRP